MSARPLAAPTPPTGRLHAVLTAGRAVETDTAVMGYRVHKDEMTGAPPPLGPGTGFLFVVANSNVVKGTDLGKSVLLIKEKNTGLWGPPGGQTDKTDHSPLHAAMREFSEEVGADWRRLANKAPQIAFVRIRPTVGAPAKPNESWALFTNLSALDSESVLFADDRSGWTLTKRINHAGAKDSAGYAFIPVRDILKADKKTGEFAIGPYVVKLRDVRRTTEALLNMP